MLNNVVAEAIGENLAWQGRDVHPRALALEYVTEIFKVAVAPAHRAVLELECRYVRSAHDLVVCVHIARGAMCLWIADLENGAKVSRNSIS